MSERGFEPKPAHAWDSADAYEAYVGRWSRPVARAFLAWLDVPRGGRWLDVGCGTGALTRAIVEAARPVDLLAIDPSPAYVATAREQVVASNAAFKIGDARALPVPDGAYDAVVSGLVLNFVPAADQPGAVAEMRRAARPGGTAAAYVWDYAGDMQMMRRFWDAAIALDPDAKDRDEGRRSPICNPDPLVELFRGAGLDDVTVRAIDVVTRFRDFDDFWSPFLGGQGSAPGYVMSLDDDHRAAIRDRLRATLPFRPDGSIDLIARAWAVRGLAPSASPS